MLGRLNHVAIAVPDLTKGTDIYRNTLGAKVSAPQAEPAHGVTVVFVELANTKIELLEPLGETSPIKGFLEKNPSGGIHHICYEVADIARRPRPFGEIRCARAGRWPAENWRPWKAGAVSASQGFLRHTCGARTGMKITSIIAIYFVTWWLCLFLVLPWGIRNASEAGERVEQGNDPGAPVNPLIVRKLIYTTILASLVFGIFYAAYSWNWAVLDYLPGPNAPS